MRRFRLTTALLMVVIVALVLALVDGRRRAARREAELRAEVARMERFFESQELLTEWKQMTELRQEHMRRMNDPEYMRTLSNPDEIPFAQPDPPKPK